MSALQSAWDKALTALSHELVPSEESLQVARSVADRVFRLLQSKSKYSIDRPMIMGSIGKKTALKIDYDFDCDIFVNNVLYEDFANIKSDFEDVITLSNLNANDVRNSKVALQLTLDGLEFDIVPAVNFRDHNRNKEQQRERALSFIKRLPNPVRDGWRYESSLVEWQVEFINRQSAFAHDLIRLAKFWNKSLFLTDFIDGRSSLIECIATHAANKEEEQFGINKSMLRAFRRFLDCIVDIRNLNIIFEMFYSRREIDVSISKQRPLVGDPSNPFRNYAFELGKSRDVMEKLQNFAKTTIKRLESQFSKLPINLNVVFETQPSVAPQILIRRHISYPSQWLIGAKNRGKRVNPNLIVRNEKKLKANTMGLRIIQCYLWNSIEMVMENQPSKKEVKQKMEDIIDFQICGQNSRSNWTSSSSSHNEYDVTFEVPRGEYLLKVSLDWP